MDDNSDNGVVVGKNSGVGVGYSKVESPPPTNLQNISNSSNTNVVSLKNGIGNEVVNKVVNKVIESPQKNFHNKNPKFSKLIKTYLSELSPDAKKQFKKLSLNHQRRVIAEKIKTDFYYMVMLLGYVDLGEFHNAEVNKLSRNSKLTNEKSRRLWLWARGHFKTSLITEAHTTWLIINNPNIRVLIVSNTLDIAKKMLCNIKSHFISNANLRYFFKEFCPKPNKDGKVEFGTTEYFTIDNRTRSLKEPTVMCAGIGTNLTGLHFDYMKIDDLVTKDSVSNDTQIKASKDYYASLRQLFDNPTIPREDVIGTIYHFNDLHRDLEKHPEFEKSFIKAADDMTLENRIFPERFSKQGLLDILNDPSVGPYIFSTQYMLNPINPADAKFLGDWLKYYTSPPEGLSEYVCVDPASTQKKKSDFTVIERWGIDSEGNHYLLDGVRDKLKQFERVDRLFKVAGLCKNLKYVKYEVLGGRHGDIEAIKQRMRLEGKYFPIKETKSSTSSKTDRIEQRLVGAFHAGIIYLPYRLIYKSLYDSKTYDFIQDYKLEYLQFPFCEHDDILDCHSQMFEEPIIRGTKSKPKEPQNEFDWWRQMAINAKKKTTSNYIFGGKLNKRFGIPCKVAWR